MGNHGYTWATIYLVFAVVTLILNFITSNPVFLVGSAVALIITSIWQAAGRIIDAINEKQN